MNDQRTTSDRYLHWQDTLNQPFGSGPPVTHTPHFFGRVHPLEMQVTPVIGPPGPFVWTFVLQVPVFSIPGQ